MDILLNNIDATISGKNCQICYEDVTIDNYVLWCISDTWKLSEFCCDCVTQMIETMGKKYLQDIKNADCEKSLFRLLEADFPIYITDTGNIFGNKVDSLYFNNKVHSPLLTYDFPSSELLIIQHELDLLRKKILSSEVDYLSLIKDFINKFNI